MTEETKRGSNGGTARAAKLSKDKRSAIAKAAAVKRWAKKDVPLDEIKNLPEGGVITGVTISSGGPYTESKVTVDVQSSPDPSEPKHCPACLNGQSLEEGEGTHILATVEHPITLPAAFQEAEASVTIATPPPVSAKPSKRQAKPMPKEFKSASSYAEKRLPQAIKEKSEAVAIVAAREAEINDLMRVIKALGGAVEPQTAHGYPNTSYNPPYTPPQLPPPYPEYQQPAPVMPVVTPPKPMAAGGAGVAAGMLEVPSHWYEG
jgi:hypothetical protein